MTAEKIEFTEDESVVGYVETDSGSLLLADGIWESSLGLDDKNKVCIDLEIEQTKLPVIATKQRGRRYLLIPIDDAETIRNRAPEKIDTEDTVSEPEEKQP